MNSGPSASCLLLGSFATFVQCPIHHYGFKGSASSSCAAIMITITMRLLCYRHRHHHENSLLLPFACASWLFINMCFAVSGVAQSDSKFIESVHSTDTWYISAGIFDFPAQLQVQESNLLCCPRPTSENMHLNQQFIFGMRFSFFKTKHRRLK